MLQYSFVLARVPDVVNPAADCLLRLKVQLYDRIHLKLKDSIPVFQVEIDITSRMLKQKGGETEY